MFITVPIVNICIPHMRVSHPQAFLTFISNPMNVKAFGRICRSTFKIKPRMRIFHPRECAVSFPRVAQMTSYKSTFIYAKAIIEQCSDANRAWIFSQINISNQNFTTMSALGANLTLPKTGHSMQLDKEIKSQTEEGIKEGGYTNSITNQTHYPLFPV